MKLSFKKEKRTAGLAGVGSPNQGSYIKGDGFYIGKIWAPDWRDKENKYKVMIVVSDRESVSGFRNRFFNAKFNSDDMARNWIKKNWYNILNSDNFEIYPIKDYEPWSD